MVKDTHTRVTFTCTKKVAMFIKASGGSKFINRCISNYAFYREELLSLSEWRDIFDECNFID